MPTRKAVKLTRSIIEKTPTPPAGERVILWDAQVVGLGLAIHGSGRKSWLLYHRTRTGRQRKPKLGDYGVVTIEGARELAQEILGEVVRGQDPAGARLGLRRSPTMNDLWKRYWEEHAVPHKAASSARKDACNWKLHVAKRLGAAKIVDVTHTDVATLHQAVGAKVPGAANRCLSLLSKMFNLAERWGLRASGSNPCRHAVRFKERKLERYLDAAEYRRLAAALADEDQKRSAGKRALSSSTTTAIRLLMLTGCRLSEIAELRWTEVNFQHRHLRLESSKVGGHVVQLNDAAVALLTDAQRRATNQFVCPSHEPRRRDEAVEDISWRSRPLSASALEHAWKTIRKKAGLDDVRIHDLRHSFASMAAAEGVSLQMIGKLLGHKTPLTTARYAHLADDPTRQAATRIGVAIEGAMTSNKSSRRGRRR